MLHRLKQKILKGIDITSAQGQEITRNVSALSNHCTNAPPKITGTMTKNSARNTTIGV